MFQAPTLGTKHIHGFSVIELMIVIVIISVSVGLALPALGSFLNQNKLTSSANKFVSAINLARNEAISRRESVTVTPSTIGWRVVTVPVNTSAAGTLILEYELDEGLVIDVSNDAINSVTFSSDGYRELSGNTSAFDVTLCHPEWNAVRVITINPVGVTRVNRGDGGCP